MNGWLKFALLWLALTVVAVLIGRATSSSVVSFLAGVVSGFTAVLVSVGRGWILR